MEITRERVQLMKDKAAGRRRSEERHKRENNRSRQQVDGYLWTKIGHSQSQIEREKLKLMVKGERDAERAA